MGDNTCIGHPSVKGSPEPGPVWAATLELATPECRAHLSPDQCGRQRLKQQKDSTLECRAHLSPDQGRSDVLQLQHCEAGQLLVDALEDMVVQVPGLVEVRLLARRAVLVAPLRGLGQLATIGLQGYCGLSACMAWHGMAVAGVGLHACASKRMWGQSGQHTHVGKGCPWACRVATAVHPKSLLDFLQLRICTGSTGL